MHLKVQFLERAAYKKGHRDWRKGVMRVAGRDVHFGEIDIQIDARYMSDSWRQKWGGRALCHRDGRPITLVG